MESVALRISMGQTSSYYCCGTFWAQNTLQKMPISTVGQVPTRRNNFQMGLQNSPF
jgi:hypothetical protein